MVTFSRKQPAINFKYFDFLNREALVDVTIIADGHIMQAHKVVLAAASSYFEDIFSLIPDKHPAIVLSDVTQTQLTNLIQYIYCGSIDLHESEVGKFKKLLETLKIEAKVDPKQPKIIPSTSTATSNDAQNDDDEDEMLDEIKIKEEKPDELNVIEIDNYEDDEDESVGDQSNDYELPLTMMSAEFSTAPQPPRKMMKFFRNSTSKARVKLNNVVRSENAKIFMDINPHSCPFCKKISKSNKHRNEHVKYCTMNPDRIVSKCPHCDKSFCDPYYVRKHMKTIHGDDGGSSSNNTSAPIILGGL